MPRCPPSHPSTQIDVSVFATVMLVAVPFLSSSRSRLIDFALIGSEYAVCNVEMVRVLSTDTVKKPCHVVIFGIPVTVIYDKLQSYFSQFGSIHKLYRPVENQGLVCICYTNSGAYDLVRKTNRFDENIQYQVQLCGKASLPDFEPEQSSSGIWPPINYDPSPIDDLNEDSDFELTTDSFDNQEGSNNRQPEVYSQPKSTLSDRNSSIFAGRHNSVACVSYEVQINGGDVKDIFDLVKGHSKEAGNLITIDHSIKGDKFSLNVHYKTFGAKDLKKKSELVPGRKTAIELLYPLPKNPWDEPSTSKDIKLREDQLLHVNCSIHVATLGNCVEEHYRRRFESYGRVLNVEFTDAENTHGFAIIQFTNVDDAHRAMSDANHPKPMSYSSRPDRRLIMFYLPPQTNEDIMLTIRGLSNKIEDITVDWIDRNAVVSFEARDQAAVLFKKMRKTVANNFGNHKVAVDYCSERLHQFFLQKREDNLVEARNVTRVRELESHQNSYPCVPSTSSCDNRQKVDEQTQPSFSPRRSEDNEQEDDVEALLNQESSSNSDNARRSIDFGSDEDDRISEIRDEEDVNEDEYEYVYDSVEGPSHEQNGSQSPGNEPHDEYDGSAHFANGTSEVPNNEREQESDYIELSPEPSPSHSDSPERYPDDFPRRSPSPAYDRRPEVHGLGSSINVIGSSRNYARFRSNGNASAKDGNASPTYNNESPVDDDGSPAYDNGSPTDGNESQYNQNRSQPNYSQSQGNNSGCSGANSGSPGNGSGSQGYKRFREDDDDDDDDERKHDIKLEYSPCTSPKPYLRACKIEEGLQDTALTAMLMSMRWRNHNKLISLTHRIHQVDEHNQKTRVMYEKWTGRPFPKFPATEDLKPRPIELNKPRDYYYENTFNELDLRLRDWKKIPEQVEMEELRSLDPKDLQKDAPLLLNRSSGRPSLDESRTNRFSFDSVHHPAELAQRSHSLCVGPMTPAAPFPTTTPLLVNTSHPLGTSQPSTSGVTTPRSHYAQPPPLMSPLSRHNSVSSAGRPANIQAHRHHSHVFPIDTTIPPPTIPVNIDAVTPRDVSSSRRSSETLIPLKSPPFVNQIPNLTTMPPSAPQMMAATGTQSVSSSAHSTPRHSISGTPVHYEPSTSKSSQPQTPKSSKPEKVQVRHDSISKPGPSNAVNSLQARSQSMTVADHKRSSVSTPVSRDAGSDLVAQIMSNQPSMGFKKLPRIEKKPSALQNVHNQQNQSQSGSTSTAPSTLHQGMSLKDKEKERRRKEREHEREREARKEMKRKETKEERAKRKEMERAKREEDDRRERKREKQKMKEKEERRRERERERKKAAEKEKHKKKKHRKDDDSDESDSSSNDELDLDVKKTTREMTQEEKDHQLALILSKGSIIENLKSRRRSDKRHDSQTNQKNQSAGTRRVLIESSDDDRGGEDDEDEKEKSDSSSGETSEPEKRFMQPPVWSSTPSTAPPSKEVKKKIRKEREKGELSSSSEDEENKNKKQYCEQQKLKEERENRKRQKSLTTYSSDEHGELKNASKRARRDDKEDLPRPNAWGTKEDQNQRKRKLAHRLSSEDESKRKAKQRDFRDIPHEDVSDEEEVEVASRVRRQSSSSTASNKDTSNGRKEKSGKTPLRITTPVRTPVRTPLQSPKLLSPKIISPNVSTNSNKRPSISDQEPLVSPRPRNRTVSSTSTATTSSKHETYSLPEKPLSPPVTAKSSVSSIDDFAIREEFNSNSAVASPMSSTSRPMVLTKAAMKAFNSSPPKKQSSSSGPHDSSSGSSSSSSDGSSSSSTDDSSDEETVKGDTTVVSLDGEKEKVNQEPTDDFITEAQTSSLSIDAHMDAPSPVVLNPEVKTLMETEPLAQMDEPSSPPPVCVQPSEAVNEGSPSPDMQTEQDSVLEEKGTDSKHEENLVQKVQQEKEERQETGPINIETESAIYETMIETDPNEKEMESQVTLTPSVEEPSSPKPMDTISISQEAPPSTHTLISDQETDQAVQSIFDEEEADEFPQYPDFVMTNEEKASEKSLTPQESVEIKETLQKTSSKDYPLTNGHSSNHLISPKTSASIAGNVSERSEETEDVMESEGFNNENDVSVVKNKETAVPTTPAPLGVDNKGGSEQDEDGGLRIVETPEQTPTPDLIPNEKLQEHSKEPSPTESSSKEIHEIDSAQAHAPVQHNAPLDISVAQQNQKLIQPSPQHAAAPSSLPTNSQPVSVVEKHDLEKTSPTMSLNSKSFAEQAEELLNERRHSDLTVLLQRSPQMLQELPPLLVQRIQDSLIHAGSPMIMSNESRNYNDAATALNQQNYVFHMAQQKQKEEQEYQQKSAEDKQRNEELKRRREVEAEPKVQELMNITAVQKAAINPQENKGTNYNRLLKLLPQDVRSCYPSKYAPFGVLPSSQAPEPNGLVNGNHPTFPQVQRPSSTASSSSSSARTPLQPSASFNRIHDEPENRDALQIQHWFYNHFPMVWTGRLSLKSSETNINLHLINGSETFLNDVLGRQLNDENPRRNSMKIHQRLRLDNGQVEHVYGILTSPDYACCLALSSTTDFNEEQMRINEGNLKASFIDYLIKKQIAGVSNLDEVETKLKSARVHVFAPGEMVNKYLSELASSLHEYLNNTSTRYLLIVFTNDKIEPNMEGPPSIESLAVPTLSSS